MASNYSFFERQIATFLSKVPFVKAVIKKIYQYISLILYRKKYTFKSHYDLSSIELLSHENFFGYYDKSPISCDNQFILLHEASYGTKQKPQKSKPLYIVAYDIKSMSIVNRWETHAYNWQQGAKTQWLTNESFIFNFYDNEKGEYCSFLTNVVTNESVKLPFSIYDCHGVDYALTLNYDRLMILRPDYGYRNKTRLTQDELNRLDDDGIFFCDLVGKSQKLLISLSRIVQVSPNSMMDESYHKVNHIMISPDGKHFMFLHRYYFKGRRFDRLFISDVTGKDLTLLSNNEMISHCFWLNETELIGYLKGSNGNKYYKLNIHSGTEEIIGEGIIDKFGDGHPSIFKDKMVFDTYPDKSRMKHLYLFDLKTETLTELGEFYESMKYYGETRCDLHPRFSCDGKKIFIDSVHSGMRSMYWINMDDHNEMS